MSSLFGGSELNPHRSVRISIDDPSGVSEARRMAVTMARSIEMNEVACENLALVVSEAAKNLSLHARQGELLLRMIDLVDGGGVEMLAVDRGPGMKNVATCMRDGYSTAGTPGNGLGAMARLASFFEVFSQPGTGTVILARVRGDKLQWPDIHGWTHGAICVPIRGERRCGDAYDIRVEGARAAVLVVDGLGHGGPAAEAADEALRVFASHWRLTPAEIVERLHGALRSTRGAAAAVAVIDRGRGEVHYAGIGNIAGWILGGDKPKSLVSQPGIVGAQAGRCREFVYAWPPSSTLVMHSDGLATQWKLDAYGALNGRDPSLIAALLYRDFSRGRDDVTVLGLRESATMGSN